MEQEITDIGINAVKNLSVETARVKKGGYGFDYCDNALQDSFGGEVNARHRTDQLDQEWRRYSLSTSDMITKNMSSTCNNYPDEEYDRMPSSSPSTRKMNAAPMTGEPNN